MNELVSIITPTYNHEQFIGQCIESVLAQTYKRWEQIIIDDGSRDGTRDIAAAYEDERIVYIRQENMGIWNLNKIYNRALELSHGGLIAVLEGDDFWPDYKLERQVGAFSNEDTVMSWGKAYLTNSKGKPIMATPADVRPFMNRSKSQTLRQLLFQNPIPSSTVMCRKEALLKAGGFKQPSGLPYVDLPTWLELSLLGDFCVIDEILGCWRKHEGQISSTMKASLNEGRRYPVEFFMRLPEEVKKSLGISVDDLSAYIDLANAEFSYQSGRASLLEGRWGDAENEFRAALDKGCTKTRMKALAGMICGRCRTDVEWLTAVTKEPRLKDLI